jgi:hypothetical protein
MPHSQKPPKNEGRISSTAKTKRPTPKKFEGKPGKRLPSEVLRDRHPGSN